MTQAPSHPRLHTWLTHADGWMQAAYRGDRAALQPSLGHGFWAQWRSRSGGNPIICLLASHGEAPDIEGGTDADDPPGWMRRGAQEALLASLPQSRTHLG